MVSQAHEQVNEFLHCGGGGGEMSPEDVPLDPPAAH